MIAQHIADGIFTGAIISLGAIGLTLTMGILRFANFSHSELLTWGAYMALVFVGLFASVQGTIGPLSFGWPLIVAALAAAGLTFALAVVLDRLVFARLRGRAHPMSLVFASFGVALMIRHVIVMLFGPQPAYYTRELQLAVEMLPGVRVLPDQAFVLGLAAAIVICLHLFLSRTRMGIAMRATAENPALARVNGVDVAAVIRWTWLIGAALAAFAGVLFGLTVQIRPEMGFNLILPLFAAAILGGVGNVYGAVIGGLIIGLAENLSVLVISTGYRQAVAFGVLLLVLYLRPRGLFGSRT